MADDTEISENKLETPGLKRAIYVLPAPPKSSKNPFLSQELDRLAHEAARKPVGSDTEPEPGHTVSPAGGIDGEA